MKAEQSVNARSRMKETAANPWLGTGLRGPSAEPIWGRRRQALNHFQMLWGERIQGALNR
jgi:hypothetical protein